jgi:WD repeat-containing protein 55
MKFHPFADVVAAGLIDGHVNVYKYNTICHGEENSTTELLLHLSHHAGSSCRGIEFDLHGQKLFTISSDHSWVCIDATGAVISTHQNAHLAPLNKCLVIDENTFVTGDDNGCVKLWDIRSNQETMTFHRQEDFITSFCYHADSSTLLCTSGDSTLCTYDTRKKIPKNDSSVSGSGGAIQVSDEQESELTCVTVLKSGKKVVCGTQKGVLLTFSWGKWGDCTDRYPGHPQPVDCLLKLDENTILTGSSDGLIRVVGLQPNKIYGVLGDHQDFPVEGMCRSRDGLYLGSFSHDDVLRFWDMSMFVHDTPDEGEEEEGQGEDEEDENEEGGEEETKGNNDRRRHHEEEEEDSDEDMSEEDDEEESVEGEEKGSGDEDEDSDEDSSDDDKAPKMPAFRFPKPKRGFYADL